MEVKARNVDPVAVKKIDEIWKIEGYNSRSEFIKYMIEEYAVIETKNNIYERMEKQLIANNVFLEQTSRSFDELVGVLKELIVDG
jgi:metal-responsive CopG/Arc/MetJ family transcriptional regulator